MITDKILKAIQEDLPSATAGELKKFIEEANAKDQQLTLWMDKLQSSEKEVEVLRAQEAKFNTANKLNVEASMSLAEANELTRKYNLDIKDEQIKQRDFVIANFASFLNTLVKNPRAVELISETKMVPIWEAYSGGGGYHSSQPENTHGTREKTETKED